MKPLARKSFMPLKVLTREPQASELAGWQAAAAA
jgi:hypothetical protein